MAFCQLQGQSSFAKFVEQGEQGKCETFSVKQQSRVMITPRESFGSQPGCSCTTRRFRFATIAVDSQTQLSTRATESGPLGFEVVYARRMANTAIIIRSIRRARPKKGVNRRS